MTAHAKKRRQILPEQERLDIVLKSKPAAIAFTDSLFSIQQTNLQFRKLFSVARNKYERRATHISRAVKSEDFDTFIASITGLPDEKRSEFSLPENGFGFPRQPEHKSIQVLAKPLQHGGFVFVFTDSNAKRAFESSMSLACETICREQKLWLQRLGINPDNLMGPSLSGGVSQQVEQEANFRMQLVLSQLDSYARLDEECANFELEPLALCEVLLHAEEMLAGHFPERSIVIVRSDSLSDIPAVKGHSQRLTELFFHLFHNAKKFSQNTARVHIEAVAVKKKVHLTISQSASEIAPGDLSRIFAPFYRGPEARSNYPGIGLGLALASRIARLHKGRIDAEFNGSLRYLLQLKTAR